MSRTQLFSSVSFLSIFFQIWLNSAIAFAENDALRYVSDVLVINIKDQLEKPYTVVGVVRSNDPVHIIEEQENYYKIETEDKKQGWIAKQYLKRELPDSLLVKKLTQEVDDLKKQIAATPATGDKSTTESKKEADLCQSLQQKLAETEKQLQQLKDQKERNQPAPSGTESETLAQLQEQNAEIAKQMEQTSQRYNLLVSEYEKRGKEIAQLHNSIAKQDDTTRFFWFGAGAAVFFLGLLAGKSAGRKKSKLMY